MEGERNLKIRHTGSRSPAPHRIPPYNTASEAEFSREQQAVELQGFP